MININGKKLWSTIVLLIVLMAAIHFARAHKGGQHSLAHQDIIPEKAKGSASALIHIVEYSDFECPACAQAAKLLDQYVDHNSVQMYVEFRHYPLQKIHPNAVTGAVFAECAARQGQFWPYHDQLFEQRMGWSRSARVKGVLKGMAEDLSLDMDLFRACIDDPGVENVVLQEKETGKARGVKATPTYFINDQMCVGAPCLKEKLDEILTGGGA